MSEPPKLGPITNVRRKVRRNEPCPFCASGIKFKRCHGQADRPEPYVVTAAGHPQEHPVSFLFHPIVHKGPRPAERKVLS